MFYRSVFLFFFLMIRRPPRSTQSRSSAASDVYKRQGNAALEEVVMALKYLGKVDMGLHTNRFRELSEYVAAASARTIPAWKSIVGVDVFAHESGIHADGVIKNPLNYEAFAPEDVGLERQIVVGKHSGSRTIYRKFQEFGLELTQADCDGVLALVRKTAVELKRALFDKELMYIYQDYLARLGDAVPIANRADGVAAAETAGAPS